MPLLENRNTLRVWNTWELVYTATRLEGEACFFPFFAFGLSSSAVILTRAGAICSINYPWRKLGTTPILHIKNHECYSKLNYSLAADKGKVSGRELRDWKPRRSLNGTGVLVVSFNGLYRLGCSAKNVHFLRATRSCLFVSFRALILHKGILHVVLRLQYIYSGIMHVASLLF